MCLVKVSKIEVVILKISLCISLSRVCVYVTWIRSYKKREADVIAVMCVSFNVSLSTLMRHQRYVCVMVILCRSEQKSL